jgi:hypothetical protein
MSFVSRFQQVADAFEREKRRLSFYKPTKPAKPAPAPAKPAGKRKAGEGPDAAEWSDTVSDPVALAASICRAAAKARGEITDDDDADDDQDDQEIVDADEEDDNAKKAKDLAKKIIEAGKRRRNEQ